MRFSWGRRTCRGEALGLVELKVLLLAALAGYLGVAGLVWLTQESMMFFPRPVTGTVAAPAGWHLEQVSLDARDGTRLAGVLALPPLERAPLIIYFGGNAEEVTEYAPEVATEYGNRAVLLVNYRGYGASGGKPGERAMVGDALEVFDWAARHARLDMERVAVHGRSLGSAVAVQLAAERPVRCVVLTSPFASAVEVARDFYSWLPVAWLMRHPFDLSAVAPRVKAPALVIYGEDDSTIKPRQSERLASLWGGPVEKVPLPGFGHNDLHLTPRYGQAIRAFLDRCQ
jgi:fermentation-respiration switch protein FrsA (DUF1100 family)